MRICLALVLSAVVSATALVSTQSKTVRVRVQTELGDIVIEVDPVKAPITTANFLKYVDGGHYDGGIFHRTVKMDNQPESTVKIEVIQAGVNPDTGEGRVPGDRARAHQRDRHAAQGRRGVDGARRAGQRHVGLVHLHQRSAVARFRRHTAIPTGRASARLDASCRAWTSCGRSRRRPHRPTRTTNTEAQRLTPPIKILKVARVP